MKAPKRKLMSAAIALALAAGSAHAVLERVGPIGNNTNQGGYPVWYQDTTGVAIEFCDPHADELDGGWCLLLPGDVNAPENLSTGNFFDEHFYFAADAALTLGNLAKANLVLAVEAAFAGGVAPGEQITFSRIRFKITNVPVSGTYRFIHPYGEDVQEGVAGERIFVTDDIGITTPGDFSGALNSRLGPFLVPVDANGKEMPAVTGPGGRKYIADPAAAGPVTGSQASSEGLPPGWFYARASTDPADAATAVQANHNVFRIEGPKGSNLDGLGNDFIETRDFALMGRLFAGAIPGKVDVDRASYSRANNAVTLDVFATANETTQARLPSLAKPAGVVPQLTFYNAACSGTLDQNTQSILPPYGAPAPAAGVVEGQMYATGQRYWGRMYPEQVPDYVCVKDLTARDLAGNLVPTYSMRKVSDVVTISKAEYDAAARKLNVSATSSDDTIGPDKLTVVAGTKQFSLASSDPMTLETPTPTIAVRSESQWSSLTQTTLTMSAGALPPSSNPLAFNIDFGSYDEPLTGADSITPHPFDKSLLTSGKNLAGGSVNVVTQPRLGSLTVDNGMVTFYPLNDNVSGADAFTYTVTVGTATSNVAVASFTIKPTNDLPVGVDDAFAAQAGVLTSLDVLANDTDPDGPGDIASAVEVSAPLRNGLASDATATYNPVTRKVDFQGSSAGTYTFTYKPRDASLTAVAPARVTVTISAPETVNATTAEYVTSKNRWKVSGTSSITTAHTMTLKLTGIVNVNGVSTACNADGRVIGSTTATGGSFAFDILGATGALDPRTTNCNAVLVESALGGVDPTTPVRLK